MIKITEDFEDKHEDRVTTLWAIFALVLTIGIILCTTQVNYY